MLVTHDLQSQVKHLSRLLKTPPSWVGKEIKVGIWVHEVLQEAAAAALDSSNVPLPRRWSHG